MWTCFDLPGEGPGCGFQGSELRGDAACEALLLAPQLSCSESVPICGEFSLEQRKVSLDKQMLPVPPAQQGPGMADFHHQQLHIGAAAGQKGRRAQQEPQRRPDLAVAGVILALGYVQLEGWRVGELR